MKVKNTKMTQGSSFGLNPFVTSVTLALVTQFGANVAYANGGGYGSNTNISGATVDVPTYYANSPQGIRPAYDFNTHTLSVDPANTVDTGAPLRKFVDPLAGAYNGLDGMPGATDLQSGIPVAITEKWFNPITNTQTNDDYLEIAIVEYTEKMHSDLPKGTTLRGFVQVETDAIRAKGLKDVTGVIGSEHIAATYPDGTPILDANNQQVFFVHKPHYLGPVIVASKGTPVRMKYTNYLPYRDDLGNAVGAPNGGDLLIPVDEILAGGGPTVDANGNPAKFSQNRVAIHWHGGDAPWISDGTPHQWIAPARDRNWKIGLGQGPSFKNVPDMPDPGPGAGTMYFPNNLSGRLMMYHDHASGLTRLNAYYGVAAGYVVVDPDELTLVANAIGTTLDATSGGLPTGLLDAVGIPLVIQDKTFVPKNIGPVAQSQDAKWDLNHWGQPGDLWFPHVYETNQDPNSADGTNPVGRWDWGPWFWPVFPSQYSLPSGAYGDVSTTPEAFMDTPIVNGQAYPTLSVDPKTYRFRILSIANDRTFDLSLFQAVDANGVVCDKNNPNPAIAPTAPGGLAPAACTEVRMVPATPTATFPASWPTDGRVGGVPDPATAGPDIVAIGSEGGVLPAPAILKAQPVTYDTNVRSITVLNVLNHGLLLGGGERADVLIDFSKYAGQTLIMYNDAPAPMPGLDPRIDYYTGAGDMTDAGGAYNTLPGYGPNTRTVMQIKVADKAPAAPLNVNALAQALPLVYAKTQPKPVIPETVYNAPFGMTSGNNYASIFTGSASTNGMFTYIDEKGVSQQVKVINKAIQELFDPVYGRMNATLAVELPFSNALIATTIPLAYIDAPVESIDAIKDDEVQIWKITHNGVDSHPVHFHMVNVQVLNRVDWAGVIKPPAANEVGWKETVMMNPLEDIYVAVRAKHPVTPFGVPKSSRALDPSQPLNAQFGFTQIDPTTGQAPATPYSNIVADFDNEYVWHCHILGHEENDFMRPFVFHPNVVVPDMPAGVSVAGTTVSWIDPTPFGGVDKDGIPTAGTNVAKNFVEPYSNPKNELGFKVLESTDGGTSYNLVATLPANATSWTDVSVADTKLYQIVAYNVAGESTAGVSIVQAIPVAPVVNAPNVPATAAPAAPVSFAQTLNADGTITLSWAAVDGATSYVVTINGVPQVVTGTSLTIPAATNSTITVAAVGAGGTSTTASLYNGAAYAPVAVTASQGTGAPGSITLTWANNPLNVANVTGLTLSWTVRTNTGVGVPASITFAPNTTGATIIGLRTDRNYTFSLVANGILGNSTAVQVTGLSAPIAP